MRNHRLIRGVCALACAVMLVLGTCGIPAAQGEMVCVLNASESGAAFPVALRSDLTTKIFMDIPSATDLSSLKLNGLAYSPSVVGPVGETMTRIGVGGRDLLIASFLQNLQGIAGNKDLSSLTPEILLSNVNKRDPLTGLILRDSGFPGGKQLKDISGAQIGIWNMGGIVARNGNDIMAELALNGTPRDIRQMLVGQSFLLTDAEGWNATIQVTRIVEVMDASPAMQLSSGTDLVNNSTSNGPLEQ